MTPPAMVPSYDTMVVDGSYLLHRVLHAGGGKSGEPPYAEMMTSTGQPTGGVYGCLKSLRSVINRSDFLVRDVVVVWDGLPARLSTRRTSMYPNYKSRSSSGTEPSPDSIKHLELFSCQRPLLDKAFIFLGIPVINVPYFEGDDIIAAFVKLIKGSVLIMSDDKDYYQLVSDRVHVYRAVKDMILNSKNFTEITKIIDPPHYLLYKALRGGDDGITGIDGVGGTTASKIANSTQISEAVSSSELELSIKKLMNSDSRSKSRYQSVLDNIDIVIRNILLMDLRLEDVSPPKIDYCMTVYSKSRGPFERNLIEMFRGLEFKSYLENFSSWIQPFKKLRKYEVGL